METQFQGQSPNLLRQKAAELGNCRPEDHQIGYNFETWNQHFPLADKVNGNDAERYEGVKLAVVAGHKLAGKLLGKRDSKAVG